MYIVLKLPSWNEKYLFLPSCSIKVLKYKSMCNWIIQWTINSHLYFKPYFNSFTSLLILTTLWMLSMTYKRNYIRCNIVFEIKKQKCTFLLCKTYTYNGKLMMYIAAALKYMGSLYILNGKLDASSVDTYFKLVIKPC